MLKLYDYIYVDRDKVVSLYSQLTGGIVEIVEQSEERSGHQDNKRRYDFRVFQHDAGGSDQHKSATKQSIKPHHALYGELEAELSKRGFLIELSEEAPDRSMREDLVRTQLKHALCVKVTGRAVIEDYERVKAVATQFPKIAEFISRSAKKTLSASDEVVALKAQIKQFRDENANEPNRAKRNEKQLAIKQIEKKLDEFVDSGSSIGTVEPWILSGISMWIDTFLRDIVNLRVYPVRARTDEHVFGHLKRTWFEGLDSGSLHFTHGYMPTDKLTMIGIVSSVPDAVESFKPLSEFARPDLSSSESVEHGLRNVFAGVDSFEQMVRTCRFPRVLVHPIMVYREFSGQSELTSTY